eukprot:TRINITY_DN8668_c0_g1_i1.p1 TRINITY_DN8668_c0_g1~~TRINITY_DN8668_c0_g1_i1.p1  ORF type:complete len:2238 (+),score=513.48 TRINITY_DN8668_c0_g1_i1:606-7319(+)
MMTQLQISTVFDVVFARPKEPVFDNLSWPEAVMEADWEAEVPAKWQRNWRVHVDGSHKLSADPPLGLWLVPCADETLEVRSLETRSPIYQWNREHPEDQVLPGDHVVQISGARGVEGMMTQLQISTVFDVVFARPKEPVFDNLSWPEQVADIAEQVQERWCVTINGMKGSQRDLGMWLAPSACDALEVRSLDVRGPVWQWNEKHPSQRVMPGDRLVEISGARGTSAMLNALENGMPKELFFIRPSSAASDKRSWPDVAPPVWEDPDASQVWQCRWNVNIDASQWESIDPPLGVWLAACEGNALEIRSLESRGPLWQWNLSNTSNRILPGDRIVEVSGSKGVQAMMNAIETADDHLEIIVVRPLTPISDNQSWPGDEKDQARWEEETRLRREEDIRRLEAEEQARQEALSKAREVVDIEAQQEAEEDARRKADADELARREAEENARRKEEAEARKRREAEASAREKAEEEARLKAEAEAKARIEAEAHARALAEEEARLKAEAEAQAKREAEAMARERAAIEARQKAEAEERQKLEIEAKARREAEAKARAKAEDEARQKAEAEEQARLEAERQARERVAVEARLQEEEAARQKVEAELRLRREAEAAAREKEEEEARLKAEAAARELREAEARARDVKSSEERAKLEEEIRQKYEAEQQARHAAEAKAREKDAIEAKLKEEEEARQKAEAEAQARRDEEAKARAKAEEEARLKAEVAAQARQEAEAKARESAAVEERLRKEEELRQKEDAERQARQEAEAKELARQEEEARARELAATEARLRAEEEAQQKANAEAQSRQAAEARQREEEEKIRLRAEESARRLAEDEARRQAEEEKAKISDLRFAGTAIADGIMTLGVDSADDPPYIAHQDGATDELCVGFHIDNLDFHKLKDDQRASIEASAIRSVAKVAGVPTSFVHVQLSAGSVRVLATVRQPPGDNRALEMLRHDLSGTSMHKAAEAVMEIVVAIPGIDTAKVDSSQGLTISNVAVTLVAAPSFEGASQSTQPIVQMEVSEADGESATGRANHAMSPEDAPAQEGAADMMAFLASASVTDGMFPPGYGSDDSVQQEADRLIFEETMRSDNEENERLAQEQALADEAERLIQQEAEREAREKRKAAAEEGLEAALRQDDIDELRAAIEEAAAAGVPEDDLEAAWALLLRLEAERREQERVAAVKAAAWKRINDATESGDIAALEAAIDSAEDDGLTADELEGPRDTVLKAKQKIALEEIQALIHAAQYYDEGLAAKLKVVMKKGEDVELRPAQLKECRKLLMREEKRSPLRTNLQKATENRDIEQLKMALQAVDPIGLPSDDPFQIDARRVLAEELRKVAAREQLKAAIRVHTLEALQAAVQEAEAAGLDEDDILLGRDALQVEELRILARAGLAKGIEALAVCSPEGNIDHVLRGLYEAIITGCEAGLAADELACGRRKLALASDRCIDVELMRVSLRQGHEGGMKFWELVDHKRKLSRIDSIAAARRSLADALEREGASELDAAIREGEAAKLEESELALARSELFARLQRDASECLGAALPPEDEVRNSLDDGTLKLSQLQTAVEKAHEAHVSEDEIQRVQDVLTSERFMNTARQGLQHAKFSRKKKELIGAIAEADFCGLRGWEIKKAHGALRAERKADACKRLKEATTKRDISLLKAALAEGDVVGLSINDYDYRNAETTLHEEERKVEARIVLAKARANREEDPEGIYRALQIGEEAWLDVDELEDLKAFCENEDMKKEARKMIADALATGNMEDVDEALHECRHVELDESEWEAFREDAAKLRRKIDAKFNLIRSLEDFKLNGDGPTLREAIAEAEYVGWDDELLKSPRAHIAAEDRCEAARLQLQEAAKAPFKKRYYIPPGDPTDRELRQINIANLRAAIAEGEAAQLFPNDVDLLHGKKILKQEFQKEAMDLLGEALEERLIPVLRQTVTDAEDADLRAETCEVLAAAKLALDEEERKAAARVSCQDAVQCHEIPQLEDAIGEAENAELWVEDDTDPDYVFDEPDLAAARDTLKVEQRKATARSAIQLAAGRMIPRIDELYDVIAEGEGAGLTEAEIVPARDNLNKGFFRKASDALAYAIRIRSEEQMKAALEEGARLGLSRKQLEAGQREYEAEKLRNVARRKLAAALASGNQKELALAVQYANDINLDPEESKKARCTLNLSLRDERLQNAARTALQRAVQSDVLGELRAALKQADKVHLQSCEHYKIVKLRIAAKVSGVLAARTQAAAAE